MTLIRVQEAKFEFGDQLIDTCYPTQSRIDVTRQLVIRDHDNE